jgi:hypothetical protein
MQVQLNSSPIQPVSPSRRLPKPSCRTCHGSGLLLQGNGNTATCHCVFRAKFRTCYSCFRECAAKQFCNDGVSLRSFHGPGSTTRYGRVRDEYMADFCLVNRRHLNQYEHEVFKYHFVLGGHWRVCCANLNMHRDRFFHTVFRIEVKLGKTFALLTPYGLYPLDYFSDGAPQAATA